MTFILITWLADPVGFCGLKIGQGVKKKALLISRIDVPSHLKKYKSLEDNVRQTECNSKQLYNCLLNTFSESSSTPFTTPLYTQIYMHIGFRGPTSRWLGIHLTDPLLCM
jgi:hypothetical protein